MTKSQFPGHWQRYNISQEKGNGKLHIVPHADGRWLWRFKRLSPSGFQRLTPKLLEWRAARRRRGNP